MKHTTPRTSVHSARTAVRHAQRALQRWGGAGVSAALAVLIAVAGAPASLEAAAAQPAVPAPEVARDVALERFTADQIARAARRYLRNIGEPAAVDYRIAAEIIAAARTLAPSDAELIRLETEARVAGGERDRASMLARELLRQNPNDEQAQLRVALATVEERQDASSRLEAYELFLGPRGEAFAPSVRSRLALDASLLARETGSERRFLEYLTFATTLDPTNKEAAALYASHFLPLTDDPIERFDILTNVLLADPIDPEAMQNMAIELIQQTAFEGALELLQRSREIYSMKRLQLPLSLRLELALCTWNAEGSQAILDFAQDIQDALMMRNQAIRERALSQGLDPGPERQPLLVVELEAIRLAVAVVERDELEIRRFLDNISRIMVQQRRQLENSDISAQELAQAMRVSEFTLVWARLFAGLEIDQARDQIERLSQPGPSGEPPLSPAARERFLAWADGLEGDVDGAIERLAPLVERDPHARWATAILEERRGNTRAALIHYLYLSQRDPNTAIGSAAWFRAQELHGGDDLVRSQDAPALNAEARRIVNWHRTVFPSPQGYVSLRTELLPQAFDAISGATLRTTVRNLSPWPLAIGRDRAIPSSILATPQVQLGIADAGRASGFETIELPGRISLPASGSYTFETRLGPRLAGDIADVGAIRRSTVRWQSSLGFGHDGERPVPAPISVATRTNISTVTVLPVRSSTDALLDRIRQTSGADRARAVRTAILATGNSALTGLAEAEASQRRSTIVSGVIAELPEMDRLNRTAAIAGMAAPWAGVDEADAAVLRAIMEDERDALVLALLVSSGVQLALDDPRLAALAGSEEAWARDLAGHIADRARMMAATAGTPGG